MGWNVLFLLAGLGLIVKGGDLFVSSSVRLAELLRMPRVVIGSTLVSLATTTPELTVSILSGSRGESGLAVGNAVGSCVCNLTLILGAMAVIKHVEVHARAIATPLAVMALAGVALLFITLDLEVSRLQGLTLVTCGLLYFAHDFWRHWKLRAPPAVAEAVALETELVERLRGGRSTGITLLWFGLGAVLVIGGSWLLVDAAVQLALRLGISSMVIGLTVVAIGTSLPELVTAVSSARRDVSDLAVGNLLGANLANLTLILGSAASIHPVRMDRLTQLFSFPVMLLGMALAAWFALSGRRITRHEGAVLLACYAAYLVALISLTALGSR